MGVLSQQKWAQVWDSRLQYISEYGVRFRRFPQKRRQKAIRMSDSRETDELFFSLCYTKSD